MLKAYDGYKAAQVAPDILAKCLHIVDRLFLLGFIKWSFRKGGFI